MIKKDIEKNNRERKQLSRMNEKTLNPEKYLLKKQRLLSRKEIKFQEKQQML